MNRLVVGIDPGTGKASPTGFACFDPDSKEIIHTEEITSKQPEYRDRYREIAGRVHELLEFIDPDLDVLVVCESFVMRGKGGEILARLTGAIMAMVPERQRFALAHNTTVKKVVGGHGHADKEQVFRGVLAWFGAEMFRAMGCPDEGPSADISDALAIGITGHLNDGK